MRRFGTMVGGAGAAFAAFLLLVGPLNWGAWGIGWPDLYNPFATSDSPNPESPSDEGDDGDEESTPSDEGDDNTSCDDLGRRQVAVDALDLGRTEVRVGNEVSWRLLPEAQPQYAFGSEVRSRSDLVDRLNARSDSGTSLRALLNDQLSEREYECALEGKGFVPVQPRSTLPLDDNWWLMPDGTVKQRASVSQPGEILWVFPSVDNAGKVFMVRAWCANPVTAG
jgi:hypothetical protein